MQTKTQPASVASGDIVVPAGDCRFSTDPSCRLVTRGVDSCIALAVHAPKLSVAALLRFSEPAPADSSAEPNPWLYGETAIPFLLQHFHAIGAQNRDLTVYAVGAATDGSAESAFRAKNNELAMRRVLWREGLLLKGEDMGGTSPRSLWFEPTSGRIIVRAKSRMPVSATRPTGGKLWHFAC